MDKQVIKTYGNAEIEAHALKVGGKRNLREVEIETEDNEVFVYLIRRPSRSVLMAITDAEKKGNVNSMQNVLMGCVLEGDKEAYENDGSIYLKLLSSVGSLVKSSSETIKKL